MDIFRQIVTLLDGYKLRNIDVIGNDSSDSRFTELYRLLKDETITTDKEAAIHFYGENARSTDIKYRVFKNDFKKRLLTTLLFIDTDNENLSEFERVRYQSTQEWASIDILFKRDITYAAHRLRHMSFKQPQIFPQSTDALVSGSVTPYVISF
jgi:hypothetical protein